MAAGAAIDYLNRSRPLSSFEQSEIQSCPVYFIPAKRFIPRGVNNSGFDDENSRYLTTNGDHIAYRYQVESKLGRGAFGDCWLVFDHKEGKRVALKVIRNERRFLVQGNVECQILEALYDGGKEHNCVNMLEHFKFRGHLCITFDLHSHDLYTELKARDFIGFSMSDVRGVMADVLKSLMLLKQKKIVHADLKPENILLAGETGADVKVIDFGSSCFEHGRVHTYVQSRYYRSPEIVLGLGYGCEIDMWSLACILVELITGRPIFPAKNEHDLILYQQELLGQVPDALLATATRADDFFVKVENGTYRPRKVTDRKGRTRIPGSRLMQQAIQTTDPMCADFLKRCFTFDPKLRITPSQALEHEFFSGTMNDRKWGSNGSLDSGVDSQSATDSPGL